MLEGLLCFLLPAADGREYLDRPMALVRPRPPGGTNHWPNPLGLG
ncbi:hypothetical protein OHS70_26240 [Streptomyces sp. NBC_00390]